MHKRPSIKQKRKVPGLAPGSLIFTGDQKVEQVMMHYLQYDGQQLKEETLSNHQKIKLYDAAEENVDWYDIRGLHDTGLIGALGTTFHINSLVLEDVVDIYQRPKFEEYERGCFVIIKALSFDKSTFDLHTEQVAIYFRKGLLLSFQENASDLFSGVRKRLLSGKGRIRERGADYLCYCLLDEIVDYYYIVFDQVESCIETLENQLLAAPDSNIKERIHTLKKELVKARKSVAPLREAINQFSKIESVFIDESSLFFIRDLYDHTIQIMDSIDTFRDLLNGLQDLYLSEISFKMNQIMQVLTIITTIFVPLSFLAGLYGMNFKYIPELEWQNGYFILLIVMLGVALTLLYFFKRKKWL